MKNYTVVVNNDKQFTEVITHLSTIFPSMNECHLKHKPFEIEWAKDGKYLINRTETTWGYNSWNSWNSPQISYNDWKTMIAPKPVISPELLAPALPEKWFIRFNTPEQAKVIIAHFAGLNPEYKGYVYSGPERAFTSDGRYLSAIYERRAEYKEISFDTFQSQVVNKTNMNKFSVGSSSKHLKAAFIEELKELGLKPMGESTDRGFINTADGNPWSFLGYQNKMYAINREKAEVHYDLATQYNQALEAFKSANKSEVVRPKVGEYAYCLEGFSTMHAPTTEKTYGGGGYRSGKVFRVRSIDKHNDADVYWPEGGGSGVYAYALRKATETEVTASKIPIEVTLDIEYEDGTFEVIVGRGTIKADDEIGSRDDLVGLIGMMENTGEELLDAWAISFEYVTLGCKHNIPLSELKRIVAEYDKINN